MNFLLSQLLGQGPMLLVYIGGLVACAVLWGRAPLPAMLAVIGLALMLFSTLGGAVVSNYIFQNRGSTTAASMGNWLAISSLGFFIVRAIGLALLVAGVFARRMPGVERGFDVAMTQEPQRPND